MPSLKIEAASVGMLPGTAPPTVQHVPEHRGEADQVALVEDRDQHHEVVEVADRAGARVGVVLQDDVAGLELEAALLEHVGNVRAELADDHLALGVADHREFVVLLADHRRHRRAEQHRIHFVARVAQRVLDQVERDGVEPAGLRAAPAPRGVSPAARAAVGTGGRRARRAGCSVRASSAAASPNISAQRRSAASVARLRAAPSSPLARAEPNCIFEVSSTVSLHSTVTEPRSVLCSTTSDDQREPNRSLSIA